MIELEELKNWQIAFWDKVNGMTYQQIANKHNVSVNTVGQWQNRYFSKITVHGLKNSMYDNWDCIDNVQGDTGQDNNDIDDTGLLIPIKREVSLVDIQEVLSDKAYQDLEPRQREFVDEYMLNGHNATNAYLKAYKCSRSSANPLGSRLLAVDSVAHVIAVKMAERASATHVDLEYLILKVKSVLDRCMQAEPVMVFDKINKRYEIVRDENGCAVYRFDSKGSLVATEQLAKLTGLLSQINQHLTINQSVDSQTSEQNQVRFKELLAKIQGDAIDIK